MSFHQWVSRKGVKRQDGTGIIGKEGWLTVFLSLNLNLEEMDEVDKGKNEEGENWKSRMSRTKEENMGKQRGDDFKFDRQAFRWEM